MQRDAVVGLVGAGILLLALVGVFRFESTQVPGLTYVAGAPQTLPPVTGSAAPGQPYSVRVPVSLDNLTRAEFTLESQSGTFNLSVQSPGGETRASEGTGRVFVLFAFPLPTNGTAAGSTGTAGNWTLTFTLRAAGSSTPTAPSAVPVVGGNNEVAYTLRSVVTPYVAR